ncbi:MFS transporter [Paraburkholderia sp. D15]|uniref:MFS transporter n=1 Tax=Paraburkholderia sp. D15 TaxID=2880218 RepID=UPI002478FE66|nr:MFS transporter [Paraburkholderia sp. D15]WGS54685.1 MFS transporter [Paraburkholderia sp. D15]
MEISPKQQWRNALASTIGNMLEWYDFIIFGFLSVLISRQFFPASDPYTALLSTTATFGAGFIFRPLGGVLIGMYADRAGRKKALSLVITLMTFSTAILAFTPTYATIGVGATVLVVLARIVQGISAGGEFGTATAVLVEFSPKNRKNLFGSLQMFAQCFGSLLSALMGTLLTTRFSDAELESWAWRIPFVVGLLIGPLGFYLRRNMTETEAFEQAAHKPKGVLRETVRSHKREIAVAVALSSTLNVMAYVVISYLPIYAVRNLGLPASVPFKVLVIAGIVRMILIPFFGILADRIGADVILRWTLWLILAVLYPCYYWTIHAPSIISVLGTSVIFAVLMGAFQGPISTYCAELFPVPVRSTGLSVAYNIGASLLGGFTPFVLTWLLHDTGDKYIPAHYCAFFFVIGLIGLKFGAPTSHNSDAVEPLAKPIVNR